MKLSLNLATRSYPNRRALAGSLLLLCFVLGVVLIHNTIGLLSESDHRQRLSQRLATLEQTLVQDNAKQTIAYSAEALEIQRSRILLANRLLEQDTFRWTALLDRFEEVVPDGVRLSSVSPRFKDGGVTINGSADDVPTLRKLLDRLLASEHFTAVRLSRQSRVKKDGHETVVQFSLSLLWKEIL